MRIVAASVVRNQANFIETMIRSVSWVDVLVIYLDHSGDATERIITELSHNTTLPQIDVISLGNREPMMSCRANGERDTSNEMSIRNEFVQFVFDKYSPSVAVLIDGDELMSNTLLPHIVALAEEDRYDSMAFGCLHLYDGSRYLDVFEATWNGITMIDPHVRVIKHPIVYEVGDYAESPDCFIRPSSKTFCLREPVHIHLKYLRCLSNRNHTLRSLPTDVRLFEQADRVRQLQFPIPLICKYSLNGIQSNVMGCHKLCVEHEAQLNRDPKALIR